MKWVTLVLTAALCYFHYHLWIAKGSWWDMSILQEKINIQKEKNQELSLRNASLMAEVNDLEKGKEAISEIARVELGYTEEGEIFYRLIKR